MNENEIVSGNNSNENNIPEISTPELNQKEKNKRGKAKFLIIGFLIVIAIGVGLYIGYKKLNNDPMSIYKDSINGIYKVLNNALKDSKEKSLDNIDIMNDPVLVSIDTNLTSSMPELKNFTGLNYQFTAGLDYKNKKMNLGLGIKDTNSSIISAVLSVINKNIYLKSEELYNKVIDLGEEEVFENMDLESYFKVNGNSAKFDYDNYIYILKEFKTIIIDSLDKNKFDIEEDTITINGKEYKGKKAIYNLDKENMERTIKFTQKRILEDEKLIKVLAESIGTTENALKDALNEEISMSGYNDTIINLYTDKLNNVIAGSIITDNEEILKFDYLKDEFNLEIMEDSNVLKVLKDANDYVTVTYNENGNQLLELNFEGNDKDFKMPYTFNIDGNTISGTLEFKNIESGANGVSSDFVFSLNASIAGQKIDFALEGNYKIAKTEIKTLDTAGSIKIGQISEEEALEIFNKVNTILERFGLNNILGSIM